jgi:hypothetical protein
MICLSTSARLRVTLTQLSTRSFIVRSLSRQGWTAANPPPFRLVSIGGSPG